MESGFKKEFFLAISEDDYVELLDFVTAAVAPPKYLKNKMLQTIYQGKIERIVAQTPDTLLDFSGLSMRMDEYHSKLRLLANEIEDLRMRNGALERQVAIAEKLARDRAMETEAARAEGVAKLEEKHRGAAEFTDRIKREKEDLLKLKDQLTRQLEESFSKTLSLGDQVAALKEQLQSLGVRLEQEQQAKKTLAAKFELLRHHIETKLSLIVHKKMTEEQISSYFAENENGEKSVSRSGFGLLRVLATGKTKNILLEFLDLEAGLILARLEKPISQFLWQDVDFIRWIFDRKADKTRCEVNHFRTQLAYFETEAYQHKSSTKKFTVYKRLYLRDEGKGMKDLENALLHVLEIGERVATRDPATVQAPEKGFFGVLKTKISRIAPQDLVDLAEQRTYEPQKVHPPQGKNRRIGVQLPDSPLPLPKTRDLQQPRQPIRAEVQGSAARRAAKTDRKNA